HGSSGNENERVQLTEAQYHRIWQCETCRFFADSRTILGERSDGFPDSRSGLIIGDFANQSVPSTTLASRDAFAKTPLLERSLAVWHVLWASLMLQGAFRAWFG